MIYIVSFVLKSDRKIRHTFNSYFYDFGWYNNIYGLPNIKANCGMLNVQWFVTKNSWSEEVFKKLDQLLQKKNLKQGKTNIYSFLYLKEALLWNDKLELLPSWLIPNKSWRFKKLCLILNHTFYFKMRNFIQRQAVYKLVDRR